ncbi:MAG TPA: GAF domain-containing protein [Holophagaceae bacterium]|nr:GAF domain-containing protein [Holophagaceae bacterium]
MKGTSGQPPSEALPGPERTFAEERALTEAILALGLCATEDRLLDVLLAQAAQIFPTPHWAVARAEAGTPGPHIAILAASPSLRRRGGEAMLQAHLPLVSGPLSRALRFGKQTSFAQGVAEIPEPYRALLPLEALLGVPLQLEGQLYGVLFAAGLEGEAPLEPWPSHLEQLENLARVATLALHRLRAEAELERRLEEVQGLNRQLREVHALATQAALEGDPAPFLQKVLGYLVEGGHIGMAWLLDSQGESLNLAAVQGLDPADLGEVRAMPLSGAASGPSAIAARTGQALEIPDALQDDRCTSFLPRYAQSGTRSLYALPLQGERGRVLGVITLYRAAVGAFPPELVAHLEAFGSLASLVVERAHLWSELQRELQQRIESELRYRVLVEESRLGVFLLQEGRLVYANRTVHQLLGAPSGSLAGKELREALGGDPELPPTELLERVRGHQLVVKDREGGSRPLELHLGRITVGGQPALLGTLEDITERFLAQEAMRHAALQAESLAQATRALSLATDEAALLQTLFDGASLLVPMSHWWLNTFDEERGLPITTAWTPSLEARFGYEGMTARTPPSEAHIRRVYREFNRVYLRDLREEDYFPREVVEGYQLCSYVCFPLVAEGRILGALNACTVAGEALAELEDDQLQALESLCASAAMALTRLKALEAERESARLAESVATGIQAIARARAESELLLILMQAAEQVAGLPHWWISAFDPETETLRTLGATTVLPIREGDRRIVGSHWEQIYKEGRPLVVLDALTSDHFPSSYLAEAPHRTYVAIPLAGELGILGSLSGGTFGDEGVHPISLGQIQALHSLCSGAALVLTRLRAEGEMTRSEARFRQLFEGAGDGVLLSHRGTVVMANPAISRMIGLPPEAMVGRRTESFAPDRQPDGRPSREVLESIREAVRQGDTVMVPLTFLHRLGHEVHTEVSASPVREGERVLVQSIIRDVTEVRRAQLEKAALERQLFQAQKMESLGVLAGGIAHDFNNLLMGVLGHVGLALEKVGPDNPVSRNLEAVQKAGQRAADLTRQMLAYSGRGQFLIRPLDLGAQVEELLKLLEVSIPKGVAMELQLESQLPQVAADESQIHQVIMNLVLNAAEAIGDTGGLIRIRTGTTHLEQADLVELVLGHDTMPGAYAYLEVEDSGCGMDEVTLSRIFEPFFTTKFTGRGLGLAALVGIVRGHRGALRVRTAPGQGTLFRIYLPALSLPPQAAHQPPAVQGPAAPGRVLVVDDEEIVRSVARQALEARGYEVIEAADGLDAVREVEARGPEISLVLLDMTMPRLGGEGAFRRIRELRPEMPVILSSGYTEQDALSRFQEPGLRGFIQKPYSPRELVAKIQESMGEA